MNGLHAIVFAYQQERELRELTEHRTTASVPFAGRYRLIDFVLSTLQNAGVNDVGIVMQGDYQSLLNHIGSGKIWDMSRKYGGLTLLPSFGRSGGELRGTVEALAGIRSYLDEIRQDYVLLTGADTVLNLPLEDVLRRHIESGADITAVCTEDANYTGHTAYFRLADDGRVLETLLTQSRPEGGSRSLGIYLLSRELLRRVVDTCAAQDHYSFIGDVVHGMAGELKIYGYRWGGYAAQMHSVREYYERSMEMLSPAVRRDLFNPARPVSAKEEDEGASYLAPGSSVRNSLVADGCTIEGSVENSILFPGVTVGRGASIYGCILFKNTCVGENVTMRHVITDKSVTVADGQTLIGHEHYPMTVGKGSKI